MKRILPFLAFLCPLFLCGQQVVTVKNNGSGTGTFNTPGVSYYLAGPPGGTWDFSTVTVKGVGGGGGGGVSQLLAGTNITLSPLVGTGIVTVNSTSGGSPGGSNTQFQYNNSGAFGGTTGLVWSPPSLFDSSSVNSGQSYFVAQNTNTGSSALANASIGNATNNILLGITGINYSGSFLSGITGQYSFLATTGVGVPLVFGTNGVANETIASGGNTTFSSNVTVNGALSAGSFILPSYTPYGVLATNASGAVAAYTNAVNVKWFGAKIDGSTPDDAAVASAIAYLAGIGGGALYIPAGVMYLTSTGIGLVNVSNVHVFGDGGRTIIDFNPTVPATYYKAITVAGSLYETGTITSGAIARGATTFTVSSSTNITAGSWLQLSQIDTGSGLPSPVVFDVVHVQSINSGTGVVTLQTPMRTAFPASRTTNFANMRSPTSQNCSVTDLQVETTSVSSALTGLYLSNTMWCNVSRVYVAMDDGNSVVGYGCEGLSIEQFTQSTALTQTAEFAYDVDLRLVNNQFSSFSITPTSTSCTLDFGTAFFTVTGNSFGVAGNTNLQLLYGVHDGTITGNSFGYVMNVGNSPLQIDAIGVFNVSVNGNSFATGDSGINGTSFESTSGWTTNITSLGNIIGFNTFALGYASHYENMTTGDTYLDELAGATTITTGGLTDTGTFSFLANTSVASTAYPVLWQGNASIGATGLIYDTTGFTFNPSTGAEAVPGSLTLGTSGSVVGSLVMNNATSGTDTIAPPTGALGTLTHTLPATSGTLALSQNAADVQTIAAGTAYTLTASNADVAFGTTSPTVTLSAAGVYEITAVVQTSLAGASYAAAQSVSYNMRRTNNTPADLAGTTFSAPLSTVAITTVTDAAPTITLSIQYTTAGTTDIIGLRGLVSATPSLGTVTCSAATINAVWLHP